MSFDKEIKGTGTRRKARECALQMLFAADLVGAERFSATRYWSELGFDEVFRGAGQLAESFRDQVSRIEKLATDLKAWLRKAEPYDKTNSRFERIKDLARASETLQTQYRNLIQNVIEDRPAAIAGLYEQIAGIRLLFDRLVNDIDSVVLNNRTYLSSEDRSQYSDLKEQGVHVLDKAAEILPQIEKMIDLVKPTRAFADRLSAGTLGQSEKIDDRIRTRAEHWRIERMAIVDRNVLRVFVRGYAAHRSDQRGIGDRSSVFDLRGDAVYQRNSRRDQARSGKGKRAADPI